jgi:hypothetical protein
MMGESSVPTRSSKNSPTSAHVAVMRLAIVVPIPAKAVPDVTTWLVCGKCRLSSMTKREQNPKKQAAVIASVSKQNVAVCPVSAAVLTAGSIKRDPQISIKPVCAATLFNANAAHYPTSMLNPLSIRIRSNTKTPTRERLSMTL